MTERPLGPSANGTRPDARRHQRAPLETRVSYAIEDDGPHVCDSSDIGGGGIRLAMPGELEPGTVLLLRFRLPGSEREIVARGKSVMSFYSGAQARYMHGVAFTQIDAADQAEIVRFVDGVIATS
jgi:c-di-GMP-binding flagellar brake protein YcgR